MHKAMLQCAYVQEFHERLRWAREQKYETASDAARALNMSIQTYLAHENGSRSGKDNAQKYARFFKVNYTWLMTGAGTPTGNPIQTMIEELPPGAREDVEAFIRLMHEKHVK